jgi:hypothetical protein
VCGDVLREEELELLVSELAQLRTEHIVDSDVVCIPAMVMATVSQGYRCGGIGEGRCVAAVLRATVASGNSSDSRKVCYCEARILVEVLRFYKAL